ncbi:MAG: Dabb family protein [Candidatus Latescibacteria bacterium]|nr:Dabb family protein [Candidatus Latescibacterota bacterium]
MIQHIVLLKLKSGTTQEQKAVLLEGLVALKRDNKISGIESVTGGDNNSPEGKTHGFDWGFVMTFTDAAARDAYLPHPDHKALGQNLLRPIVDDVLVLDYEL